MPIKQSVPKWLRCGRAVVQLAVLVECTAACSTVLAVDVDWKPLMTIAERKRDSQGALLPLQSYDETFRRGMAFLQDDHLKWFKGPPASLVDENGHTQMPWVYYSNLQHNGAPFTSSVDRFVSYPAFHHALLIRTFVGYWKYAKDARMLQQAIQLANWNIAHSTPGDWPYAHLPYSTEPWEPFFGLDWWNPDEEAAAAIIADIIAGRDSALPDASAHLLNNFTWGQAAHKLRTILADAGLLRQGGTP